MNLISKILSNPAMWNLSQLIFGCDKQKKQMYRGVIDTPGKVLDFGCSDGNTCDAFTDMEYYGLDVDLNLIEYAKKKYEDNKNVHFIAQDIFNKPFNENFFDYIIFGCTGHHLQDELMFKIIKELAYVLKPGGSLFIFDTIRQPEKDPWYIKTLISLDQGKFMKTEDWYRANILKFSEDLSVEKTDVFKVRATFMPQPTWFYAKMVKSSTVYTNPT